MNILVLHNTSDLYGASRILLIAATNLARNNHRLIVVLSEPGPLADELRKADIEVRIIRLGILRRKYFSIPGVFNRISVISKAWKTLKRLMREERIDVVYSNTTGVLIGAFLARKTKVRHIWHVHEIIKKPAAFTKVIGYLLDKLSDRVIVVSDAVKEHWQSAVGGGKLVRIYNGINCEPFENKVSSLREELNIPDDHVLVGMIGRVNHWKGQGYFIELAQEISRRFDNVRFVLAGDAYTGNEHLMYQLDQLIETSGIKDRIYNLGFRSDVPNILSGLDIFVSPSILPDPFPTVILEAMASGKPVVATNHGGSKEMIEDMKSGILIPVNEASVAAEKMSIILSDAGKRMEMGLNAHRRIRDTFSLKSFNTNMLDLLTSP